MSLHGPKRVSLTDLNATLYGHECIDCGGEIRVGEYRSLSGEDLCDDCAAKSGALVECAACGVLGTYERLGAHDCEVSR